jgi:Ankyrin repeats (3 copies)/Ankyrin repeat
MQVPHKYFGDKMTKIYDLPPEIRCKIYKHCDTKSLFNFGNTHPKYMAEIARCLKNKTDLWFKVVKKNDIKWVKMLIKSGINLNIKYKFYGWTALHYAVEFGKLDIVKALINAGADLNTRNIYGRTALHLAACGIKLDIVKALINAGADLNAKEEDGWTALHLAACYGNLDIVKALINAGADLNTQTSYGRTALHLAVGKDDIIKVLKDAGAT